MRFNKQELITLASQPSHKFDREGILILKERQDGFFRRTETVAGPKTEHCKTQKDGKREGLKSLSCVGVIRKVCLERWCRLRGNLLFYMRAAEQWSEPLGVIVLEQCSVKSSSQDDNGHWPFHLVWDGGLSQQMAALTETDRSGWLQAIQLATYECMRSQMLALQDRLEKRRGTDPDIDIQMWRLQKGLFMDINEVPLCELSLSCDNLLCDAHGTPPSPLLAIHIKMVNGYWIRYSTTEVVDKNSNPSYLSTVSFRGSDGLDGNTKVRITAYDMRERVSHTAVPMGSATVLLSTIQDTQRLRIALTNREGSTIGFLTLNGWSLESSNPVSSPYHISNMNQNCGSLTPQKVFSHRRSQSLPPRLGIKLKLPSHGSIMKYICANTYQVTYRLHSGLGGDITVHELMAESKLCYTLPQQLLGLWIQHEKELLQEVLCMGELGGVWKSKQMELLDTHLALLKYYSHARQNLQTMVSPSGGNSFKQSSRKGDPYLEFAPVNLHIQRMWVHNDTLNKSGFYDLITVGAFTAHCQKFGKSGGLFRLVQQMKNISSQSSANRSPFNCPPGTRVHMASDAVLAIKQLRGEVVNAMRGLLALAKARQPVGMMPLAEQMITKTRVLLSLWDPGLVEEALSFIDLHKTPNVACDTNETNDTPLVNAHPLVLSPFKRLTQQLSLMDLKSPDIEDFATPSTPQNSSYAWPQTANENFIPSSISSSVPNANSMVFPKCISDSSKTTNKSSSNVMCHSLSNFTDRNTDTFKTGKNKDLIFYNHHFENADEQLGLCEFKSLNFCIDETVKCLTPSKTEDATKKIATGPLKTNAKTSPISMQRHKSDPSPINTRKLSSSNEFLNVKTDSENSSHNSATGLDNHNDNANLEDVNCLDNKNEEDVNLNANQWKGCTDTEDFVGLINNKNDIVSRQFLDVTAMSSSPSANYYQPNDEPEPWDLTQLNVEASVMCLVSKVKFLCGRCGSPAVRLRGQRVNMSGTSASHFSKTSNNANRKSEDTNIVTNQPLIGKISNLVNTEESRNVNMTTNNKQAKDVADYNESKTSSTDNSSPEYIHIPLKDFLTSSEDKKKRNVGSNEDINRNKNDKNPTSVANDADEALNKTVDTVNRVVKKGNKFTDGLNLADVSDWAAELRPSMRKLRQAMDGLLKGGRLAHAVLRIRQDQNALQQAISLQVRRDICFSQALTSLVTGLLCWLWSTNVDVVISLLKSGLGPLCCVEGLLSLQGAEVAMWGDMVIAIEDLQTVVFQLTGWNHSGAAMPYISGSRSSLTVTLPVASNMYSQLPNKQAASFTITPVYFNIGINEKATIAESFGGTSLQERSNVDNFDRLNEYYLRYRKLNLPSNNIHVSRVSSGLRPLADVIDSLRNAIYTRVNKNVEILQLAAHATRRMNGIRLTSCKSAKDRTSMSCTLEQCNILATEYHLAEHEFNRALDCMRSEGCRRENTYKNTGVRKYAFNKLQLMALPKAYRPPPGTYGSAQT